MGIALGGKLIYPDDDLKLYFDFKNSKTNYGSASNKYYNLGDTSTTSYCQLFGDTNYGSFNSSDGTMYISGTRNSQNTGCHLNGSYPAMASTVNSSFTSMGWVKFVAGAAYAFEIMSYRNMHARLSFSIGNTGTNASMRFVQRGIDNASNYYNAYAYYSDGVRNEYNQWNHFALVKDGGITGFTLKFYQNGNLIKTHTNQSLIENGITTAYSGFSIGSAWSDDDYYSNVPDAYIGPHMHYTRALTDDEVRKNCNAHRGRFGV